MFPSGLYTVTATVSDPDGAGDISGGILRDVSSGATLAPFEGALGSYHASVSWALIQPHHDITFSGGTGSVEVEAMFMDRESHSGTRRLMLTLQCYPLDANACSGACYYPTDLEHCGACNNRCADVLVSGETEAVCTQGTCAAVLDTSTTTPSTCSALCAARGQTCVFGRGDYGDPIWGYGIYNEMCSHTLMSCSEVPPSTKDCGAYYGADNLNRQRCYCQ